MHPTSTNGKEPPVFDTREVLLSHLRAVLLQHPHLVAGGRTNVEEVMEGVRDMKDGDLMAMLGDSRRLEDYIQSIVGTDRYVVFTVFSFVILPIS